MKKFYLYLLLSLALIITSFPVSAATLNQVINQQQTVSNTVKEIAELDNQINTLETQIIDYNNKINQTSQDLLKAQEDVKHLTELKDNRVRAAYIYGTNGYIEYLFSGEKPTDFISHYDVAKDILHADKETLDELEKKQQEIEKLQQSQIAQRDLLMTTKSQAETLRAQKNATLASNQDVLKTLQDSLTLSETVEIIEETITTEIPTVSLDPNTLSDIVTLQGTPTSYEEVTPGISVETNEPVNEDEFLESDQASAASVSAGWTDEVVASEERQFSSTDDQVPAQSLSTSNTNPYQLEVPNTNGGLTTIPRENFPATFYWPLDASEPSSFIITSLIGSRESPGGIGSTNHGGIDIGAVYGTAVIAAASGTVEVANTYGGYGNAVMINHGNGLKTLYGHMSTIAVKQGQEVQAGQVIGFVGSTGWSTGPHLHFEVRYTDNSGNQSTLNGLSLYGQDILNRLTYSN